MSQDFIFQVCSYKGFPGVETCLLKVLLKLSAKSASKAPSNNSRIFKKTNMIQNTEGLMIFCTEGNCTQCCRTAKDAVELAF